MDIGGSDGRLQRAMRKVKLHDLDVLMTVARAGSMNKAARLLNTTQPAVSRSVKEIEQTLGVPLFDRGPRGVETNSYGRVLLDGGTAIFDDLRQTLTKINFLSDPATGTVRIGCSPLLAASFVAAVVNKVSCQYPRIEFEIIPAPIEIAYRALLDRSVDLLITRKVGPVNDRQIVFESLFEDSLVVVAADRHPWARRRKITLAELANERWVLTPSDYVLGADVIEAFRSSGIDGPRSAVITSAQDVRLSLVATGRFLTIFPASALRYPAKRIEVKVLPVKLPIASVPNGMVTLRKRMLSPAVELVMRYARDMVKAYLIKEP